MKTATMSTAECEQALGPRGHLRVDSNNRRDVRKWLNSQGFPALFSGGLSMRELQLAYNDTSGREVEKLRRKLSEASAGIETEEAQGSFASTNTGEGGETGEGFSQAQGTVGRTNAPDLAEAAQREAQAMAAHRQNVARAERTEAAGDDVARAAQALAAAIAAQEGKAAPVNADEVKRIVQDELKDLDAKLEGLTTVRIEVKLPDTDTVTALEGRHHPEFETLLQCAASREVGGFRPNIMLSGPATRRHSSGVTPARAAMSLTRSTAPIIRHCWPLTQHWRTAPHHSRTGIFSATRTRSSSPRPTLGALARPQTM